MASNDVIFQQVTSEDGNTKFRLTFGRMKSLVYRRHGQYFYLNLYDNKPGKYKFKWYLSRFGWKRFFDLNQKQLGLTSNLLPTNGMYSRFIA